MPPYKNRRRTSTNNSNSSSSADWQGLLYWSIIGTLAYIGFMALRSLSLGTGNKSSFADWLKSIFNIFEAGLGGSGGDSSNTGDSTNDNAGFVNDSGSGTTGTDLYSGSYKDYTYFKASEYFGNYPRPNNATYLANYDKLMKDLDLIRKNFGSAVKITTGYKASTLSMFQECKGVHIVAGNGNNEALNKVVMALRTSAQITGVSVYYED